MGKNNWRFPPILPRYGWGSAGTIQIEGYSVWPFFDLLYYSSTNTFPTFPGALFPCSMCWCPLTSFMLSVAYLWTDHLNRKTDIPRCQYHSVLSVFPAGCYLPGRIGASSSQMCRSLYKPLKTYYRTLIAKYWSYLSQHVNPRRPDSGRCFGHHCRCYCHHTYDYHFEHSIHHDCYFSKIELYDYSICRDMVSI